VLGLQTTEHPHTSVPIFIHSGLRCDANETVSVRHRSHTYIFVIVLADYIFIASEQFIFEQVNYQRCNK
jgi:hypothetical protein